jgi:hypothetical protein
VAAISAAIFTVGCAASMWFTLDWPYLFRGCEAMRSNGVAKHVSADFMSLAYQAWRLPDGLPDDVQARLARAELHHKAAVDFGGWDQFPNGRAWETDKCRRHSTIFAVTVLRKLGMEYVCNGVDLSRPRDRRAREFLGWGEACLRS